MANRFLSNIKINDAYTFPASDGTSGQVITTDGAGNLSFQDASASGATLIYKDTFTGDSTTVEFTMANITDNEVKTQVYFDGVYQSKDNYSINGATITFTTAPPSGIAIEVITFSTLTAGEDFNQKLSFYGKASGSISKGDAVMFAGAQGDHFLIAKATQAALELNHEYLLGLAAQDLADNEYGYVTQFGRLNSIDTTDYEVGDILWFDSEGTIAGALTTTEPSAPNTRIQIAAVVRVHQNEGVIFIRPTVFHGLNETTDVSISSVADKDLLSWNAILGVWENTKILGDITTGNITTSGTVDGVDVSLFKSDYDAHNHDSRYYTELEVDGFLANKNNWDTAYSYSQIGHLPLTGGTLTGSVWAQAGLTAGNNNTLNVNATTSRVGIGAASPVGKLHVESAGSGYGSVWSIADEVVIEGSGDTGMTIQTPNTAKGTIAFADNNTSGAYIQYNHSTDKFSIATGGSVRLTIGETLDMDGVINSTGGNSTNWNTAYGWGDHAAAGYLTSFTETDPVFSASPSAGITSTQITNWDTAYGWGNHASAGYLTSYTETDPIYTASSWYTTTNNASNWNTAYGWGNHAGLYSLLGHTHDYLPIGGKAADSELLDGVDSSRVIYGSNSTGTGYISGATLGTALKSGFYTTDGGVPNATAVNFVLHTAYYGEGNLAGFDLACNDSTSSSFYLRPATGGGKGSWQTIITSSNIGSQSVSYASNSGLLSGYSRAENGANIVLQTASNGYLYINNWIHPNNGAGLFYDSGPHFYESGATMYSSHTLRSGVSLRAPIFYDENDTGYYVDPSSTSRQYQITNNGTHGANAANARNHFVQYNSGTTSPATGWIAAAFGDGSNNRVVIGQWNGNAGAIIGSHTGGLNNWADLTYVATNHYFHSNNDYTGAVSMLIDTGHNVIARGSHRAPVFYDSNDTTYYADPNGTSRFRDLWVRGDNQYQGYVMVGGDSPPGSALNINFDQIWTASGNLHLQYSASGNIDMNQGGGYTFSRTSLRAPIFYDYNDTGFYVDPASTSYINGLNVGGQTWRGDITWNSGVNINVSGESSFDILASGGVWQVWTSHTSEPSIYVSYCGRTQIGQAGNRGLYVYGDLENTGCGIFTNGLGTSVARLQSYEVNGDYYGSYWRFGAFGITANVSTGENFVYDTCNGALYIGGTIYQNYYSDCKYKENITVIESALDKIDGIRGVEFDWNALGSEEIFKEGHEVGVIAQEVQAVYPQAVREVHKEREDKVVSALVVDQEKLIPLLLQGVKELKAIATDQQREIDNLKNIINGSNI